jgi:DNA-binding transcriptional MerR regulator
MIKSLASSNLKAPGRMVAIADLARRLGTTTRALRHYQDLGLIGSRRSARNVRAYDPETVAIVETIVALRKVDLPLAAIRQILALRSEPQAQAAVARAALTRALADKQQQVARIIDLLETLASPPAPPPRPTVTVSPLPPRPPSHESPGF